MLTSHFVNQQSLNIELPKAETGDSLCEDNVLEILINADGKIDYKNNSYENNTVSLAKLQAQLRTDLSIAFE